MMKKKITRKIKSLFQKDERKEHKFFPGSEVYWEVRYQSNSNSGPGSYGRLANFKADVLNCFVKEQNIQTIVEFGSGDGSQLGLASYPAYVGLDVSQTALDMCKEKFGMDRTKQFFLFNTKNCKLLKAELALSLDVIYHLVEDDVFENYMKTLFNSSTKYVIIYSSNYNKQLAKHVKCRKFTDWIDLNLAGRWLLIKIIPNKFPFEEQDPNNTSRSDFYIYEKGSLKRER